MNKLFSGKQLIALLAAHSKELMREPAVLFWGIIFPLLMALGLGFAFTQKKDVTRTIAVIEETMNQKPVVNKNSFENFLSEKTKKINEPGKNNGIYSVTIKNQKLGNETYIFEKINMNEAVVLLKRGEINLIVEEKNNGIEYHFDPVNQEAHLTYLNLSRLINNKDFTETEKDNIVPLTLKGTRYIDFFLPGLIAMGTMMSSMWGLGFNLIEKRSKKLIRRMIATPMKKSHFLFSIIIVRTTMNLVEGMLLFIFSYFVFNITIQGNLLALLLVFLAGNFAFSGISILSAARTASPEAGNGLISAITTPMFVLSGIFFSYHNFPAWSITFIKLLPLTALADGIRSVFIEGAGLAQVASPFFILLVTGAVCFVIGLKSFKWH